MNKPKLLNVKELQKELDEKEQKKNLIYNNILERCNNKIIQTTKQGDSYSFFPLPEFIIGMPLFDADQCRKYIMSNLEDGGFNVRYTHPNLLYISWMKEPKKKSNKVNKPKEKKSKYRVIDDYEPSGKFTYTQSSLSSIKEKTQLLLNS